MTEIKNQGEVRMNDVPVVQQKRQGSFWESISPFAKVMGITTGCMALVSLIGVAAKSDEILLGASIIVSVLLFVWVVGGHYVSAKSRGATNPGAWAAGFVLGALLAPIGIIVFMIRWSSKFGNVRRGFCPQCGRRIGFDVPECPFCGCDFQDKESMRGEATSDIKCHGCGKPLRRVQVETMLGNPGYNPWCREGFCSLECFEAFNVSRR